MIKKDYIFVEDEKESTKARSFDKLRADLIYFNVYKYVEGYAKNKQMFDSNINTIHKNILESKIPKSSKILIELCFDMYTLSKNVYVLDIINTLDENNLKKVKEKFLRTGLER